MMPEKGKHYSIGLRNVKSAYRGKPGTEGSKTTGLWKGEGYTWFIGIKNHPTAQGHGMIPLKK
jgi:hypothetical protein